MNNYIKVLTSIILFMGYGTNSYCQQSIVTNTNQPAQNGAYNKFVKTVAQGNNAITNAVTTSNTVTTNNAKSNVYNNLVKNVTKSPNTIMNAVANANTTQNTVVNACNNTVNNAVSAVSNSATKATNTAANPNTVSQQTTKPAAYNALVKNMKMASKEYYQTNAVTKGINQGITNIESSKKLLANLDDVVLKINNHIEVIQGSINTIFGNKYNGAFTNDLSNGINDWKAKTNAGLIESLNNLKNSLSSLTEEKKNTNFIEGRQLKDCKDVLEKTYNYCLGYETKCKEKIKELDKMNAITIKLKKHYNKQQLSELKTLVDNCREYLIKIRKTYFPTV